MKLNLHHSVPFEMPALLDEIIFDRSLNFPFLADKNGL